MKTNYDLLDTIKNSNSNSQLTFEEEVVLFQAIENGDDQAKDIIVARNKKLVYSIASKYKFGNNYEDLCEEGIYGLLKAINKFDYRLGNRFSTVATYWIIHEIMNAVEETSLIHVPSYMKAHIKTYTATVESLKADLQRNPNKEEIIKALPEGFPIDKLYEINQYANNSITSLNLAIGDDGDNELMDIIPDVKEASCEERLDEVNNQKALNEALANLPEKERMAIMLRFYNNKSLAEIGEATHLSKEGARQLLERALRSLRLKIA